MTPAQIVTDFYTALAARDPDRIRELADLGFAEGISAQLPASLPYGGEVSGQRRLSKMFQAMARGGAELGPRDLRLTSVIDGGETVAARMRFDYARPDGVIASSAVEVWSFRDGRATRIEAYYDDTAALVAE
ncbi:MAG: nuclear transport factor 2 family protein [Nocardioides sp.]|uniref:nuclear transport factor 2 family protein n=1 Tax=Nocardioides sp. TaxID=35761 RepID=UPI0039E5C709